LGRFWVLVAGTVEDVSNDIFGFPGFCGRFGGVAGGAPAQKFSAGRLPSLVDEILCHGHGFKQLAQRRAIGDLGEIVERL
jgi:hypothetical protein